MVNSVSPFDIEAYFFELPEENIAQAPAECRDASRLLVMDCRSDRILHKKFGDVLDLLAPGDLLVVNNTKVFPARLIGRKESGGRVELLILEYPQAACAAVTKECEEGWQQAAVVGLLKSSKRPRSGVGLIFGEHLKATVAELLPNGKVKVMLHYRGELGEAIERHGAVPLPPYIRRDGGEKRFDRQRYQTVFARETGAVAAPTAGLHFTEDLLQRIREKRVDLASITLHVGYGTFAPVRVRDIRAHCIHHEYLSVSGETADRVNQTRARGGRVWAVGTTTVRALEFAADEKGMVAEKEGSCDLYIYPGYRFKVVNNLITNFHLPRSSLLFLVSALAGRERILRGYQEAVRNNYRFYSYGDAMAIMT